MAEWSEMDVVSGLFANFCKQCAVHPVHDGSIHFTWPAEVVQIVGQLLDENIRHLQVSPRMQQLNGADETLRRAGAHMKADIGWRVVDQSLNVRWLHSHGQLRFR